MTDRKIPAIFKKLEVASKSNSTKVTSAVSNTKEGYCPLCDEILKPATANGVKVSYCEVHCIVMPVRD